MTVAEKLVVKAQELRFYSVQCYTPDLAVNIH